MSSIKFKRGQNANLNNVPIEDGSILFTEDTARIYLDTNNERQEINGDIREQVETRNFGENNIINDTIVNVFGDNNITTAKAFNIIRYQADVNNSKTLFMVNGDCSNLIGQEVTAIIDATNTRFGKVENAVFDGSNTTVTIDTYWLEQCFDPTHSNESFFIADARNTWVDVPQDNEDLDNILFFPDNSQSGTKTIGDNAIVLGNGNEATMTHSIAIGRDNKAEGKYAVAIGRENRAGYAAYAEGRANKAYGTFSHAEGNLNESTGWYSHTEGVENKAIGGASHAEGKGTIAEGHQSHTEGLNTKVQAVEGYAFHNGEGSHAEGGNTIAGSNYCHAEGLNTKAYGSVSHAEGVNTQALGSHSHAEGLSTTASGNYSHAEGVGTIAEGEKSHAAGYYSQTTSNAGGAYAGGHYSVADQWWSFAHGNNIKTTADCQVAFGRYNVGNKLNLFEIGNGSSNSERRNIFEVKSDGTVYSQEGKLATESVVDTKIAALVDSAPENLNTLNELAAALNNQEDIAAKLVTDVANKVDKVDGKGLSTNDFTDAYKTKLDNLDGTITGSITPITDEEIDTICAMTLVDVSSVLTDESTGIQYVLYVLDGDLKMMEVAE